MMQINKINHQQINGYEIREKCWVRIIWGAAKKYENGIKKIQRTNQNKKSQNEKVRPGKQRGTEKIDQTRKPKVEHTYCQMNWLCFHIFWAYIDST